MQRSSQDTTTESAPAISLRGLTKVYGSHIALDEISLDIPRGEFFVIVGPSGCGKSTLLRMLAGLAAPSRGEMAIGSVQQDQPQSVMVFQGDSIFPWMNVWENAAYGLKMRGVSKEKIHATVTHYLERTGLTAFAHFYPHQLSGGTRQRVSIARAFANDPQILMMDEPFSALDAQNKIILQEELLRIWDEDRKTVVFVTHSVEEAVLLGDRILVMTAQPGKIKSIIDVDLPRPRRFAELLTSSTYGALVQRIWSDLREEVDRARSSTETKA